MLLSDRRNFRAGPYSFPPWGLGVHMSEHSVCTTVVCGESMEHDIPPLIPLLGPLGLF